MRNIFYIIILATLVSCNKSNSLFDYEKGKESAKQAIGNAIDRNYFLAEQNWDHHIITCERHYEDLILVPQIYTDRKTYQGTLGYNLSLFNYGDSVQINSNHIADDFSTNLAPYMIAYEVKKDDVYIKKREYSSKYGEYAFAHISVNDLSLQDVLVTPLAYAYLSTPDNNKTLVFVQLVSKTRDTDGRRVSKIRDTEERRMKDVLFVASHSDIHYILERQHLFDNFHNITGMFTYAPENWYEYNGDLSFNVEPDPRLHIIPTHQK